MKRLTTKNGNGKPIVKDWPNYMEFDIINRLAAIEDILGDEYDLDLVQKLIQAYREGRYIILKEPEQAGVSHLRELAQADREGRCVVLPVKPGTPVWSTAFCKVDDDGTEHPTYPWPFDIGMVKDWGTDWFLTREEAEEELRREQE